MAETNPNYSRPSSVRSLTSYPARRGFKQAVDPALDYVVGVEDAIDIHGHATKDSRTRSASSSSPRKAACGAYFIRRSSGEKIRRGRLPVYVARWNPDAKRRV